MKKRFLAAALAGVAVFTLASCGQESAAKVEVVDSDGATTEVAVAKTDDKEKVEEAVETLLNCKPDTEAIKAVTGISSDVKASVSASFGTGSSLSYSLSANEKYAFGDVAGLEASGSLNGSITISDDDKKVTSPVYFLSNYIDQVPTSASVDMFTQDTKMYVGYSVTMGGETNSEKGYMDMGGSFTDLLAQEGITFDVSDPEEIVSSVKSYALMALEGCGVTEADIANYAESGYITFAEDVKANLVSLIEEYNVKITATSADSITFEAKIADETEAKDSTASATVSVTLSTKTLLPTSLRVSAENFVNEAAALLSALDMNANVSSILTALNVKDDKISYEMNISYSASLGSHDVSSYTKQLGGSTADITISE